jgi:6-phosphogluconolactonase
MSGQRHTQPTPKETAEACAQHILALLEDAFSGGSSASLAVSGGSTPRLLFDAFARTKFAWDRVHLFWVDERVVPPTHEQSNFRLAEQKFLLPVRYPARNVHRIQAELRPELAAQRYVQDLRAYFGLGPGDVPRFDVIHQGMGPDAHTASLFPGEPLIDDHESLAAAVWSEKMSQWRITLAPAVLLSARHSVMLVTGADKRDALHQVFHGEYRPLEFPAQLMHHAREVTWYLDAAAAEGIDG